MKTKLHIIKIGGNLIDDAGQLNTFLSNFSNLKGLKILVHGGGKKATELSIKLGIEPVLMDGRRITSNKDLEIATMVYAGLINKNITAKLQSLNGNAIGLTGADGNAIVSIKRTSVPIDFGFVGDVVAVNITFLQMLLTGNFIPVFCAITHDRNGQLLNTNADTIAADIAIALSNDYEVILHYCFEKQGVLLDINQEDSVIPLINSDKYNELKTLGVIDKGMLPKLENCFRALKNKVSKVIIGNAVSITTENQLHTTLEL